MKTGMLHLDDQRLTTPWQDKALTKLMGLKYKLVYNKGVENRAADALSRIQPQHKLDILAISTSQPMWLEVISQAYAKSPETAKILATLSIKNTHGDYSIHEGVIRLRGKILVPPDVEM